VDRRKLSAVIGASKVKIASPEATKELTGFTVGSMPPVGHPDGTRIVIDRKVMTLSKAYGGYGIPNVLIEIDPEDIARLTGAKVADICE